MKDYDLQFDVAKRIEKSIDLKRKVIEHITKDIMESGLILARQLAKGHKVMLCGNGGSAADSQHIAAELVIRFRGSVQRRALPAIALTVDTSILTAGANDIGYENVFAREVEALGQTGDVLVGISTSGNSPNVINAVNTAKKLNLITVGLLGSDGGKLSHICDYSVIVPDKETALVQECHIMIGHIWCEIIEEYLFPDLVKKNQ
ncbi:MAG: D-sedoheptulose 7-phosphate isomerase [Ignavibacteria bacterium]|nr:D-sedoheptulose 7-phosphate isomerase [Ignavibacteria bacterium]